MKKIFLAVATACTCASNATAAPQIQVYGLIDTAVSYTHSDADFKNVKDNDNLSMVTGQEFGTRLGFRGTEELGNGYKVSFTLENGFNADTGALSMSNSLFGREANVAIHGPMGVVRVGLLPIFGSVLGADGLFRAIDPISANTTKGFGSGMATASMWTRVNNAVSYVTPTFAGLTGYAMYSLKNDKGDGDESEGASDRYASLALRYKNAGLEAVFVADTTMYGTQRKSTHYEDDGMTFTLGGNYAWDNGLKVLTFVQYFKDQELNYNQRAGVVKSGIEAITEKKGYGYVDGWGTSIGVNYPMGGGVAKASFNYRDAENEVDTEFTRWTLAAAYDYPLSKSTNLYVMGGYTQEKVETKAGDEATPSGYELTMGLWHRF